MIIMLYYRAGNNVVRSDKKEKICISFMCKLSSRTVVWHRRLEFFLISREYSANEQTQTRKI
jgi:hypothetical protein